MIENVEQLIEQANLIDSESERLQFVLDYFFNTVSYDYAYLMAKGYIQGNIASVETEQDDRPIIVVNPFKKGKITIPINGISEEFDDSYCVSYNVLEGKSELFDKIVNLYLNSGDNKANFMISLYNLLLEELEKHLGNTELASSNISRLIMKINKDTLIGKINRTSDGQFFISSDIKRILLSYMLEPDKHFSSIIENGLLKRGVCQHYADYFADLLPRIGIDAIRVDGTSEMGHAWNAAIIDGELKSIDLTRAIFIRDGFKGIPADQKSSDWLIANFEDTFDMQKTRTITGVGVDENGNSISLPFVMNKENFDKDMIIELILKHCSQNKNHKK